MIQENVKEKLLKQESKHTKFYNQNTKELLPLQTGEVIQVAPKQGDKQQKWFKAQMEDQVDIRSYEVRAGEGKVLWRNCPHLHTSKEPFSQTASASSVVPSQVNKPNTPPAKLNHQGLMP